MNSRVQNSICWRKPGAKQEQLGSEVARMGFRVGAAPQRCLCCTARIIPSPIHGCVADEI
ncbi:uncharacterized protein [Physcomitrium patens]|uniref:uncharacterized protein isoform X5 n=1 Tax=Physcomitrium patens TaxID=3218 RepID=UPI003CCCEE2F